jgi:hypothetical protein
LLALEWDPNVPKTSQEERNFQYPLASQVASLKPSRLTDRMKDVDSVNSVSTLSAGEMSDLDEEGSEQERSRWCGEVKPTKEQLSEARRSARELFDLEEELSIEHLRCLQVR